MKLQVGPNLKIKNIEIKYLGEKLFENEDILENSLSFKRNNSQYLYFDILIPATVNRGIYKHLNIKDIKTIEEFLDFYISIVSDNIIFVYNSTNPRGYLTKYKDEAFGISEDIYKKNIYKVKFEINGKNEFIYFNINGF